MYYYGNALYSVYDYFKNLFFSSSKFDFLKNPRATPGTSVSYFIFVQDWMSLNLE